MLDTKRFVMLASLLFLVVGMVGVVSLFDVGGTSGVTGAAAVDTEAILEYTCSDSAGGNFREFR
mgnify:CR=1 FL=1